MRPRRLNVKKTVLRRFTSLWRNAFQCAKLKEYNSP